MAQGLQRYNSPADWARKLFKTICGFSKSASWNWKKIFCFGFVVLWGRTSQVGVSFSFYWPSLCSPRCQSNGPIASFKFFVETRLSYESLEPLIDFLAYLDEKLSHTNQKVVKLSTPTKGNQGLNNIPFVYVRNSSLE